MEGEYCHNSIMTIKNSSLINNQASVYGGGVFIEQCSDILIENCVIEDNTSADGGGIYIDNCQSSIKLNDLLVINNSSTSHGGGLAAYNLNLEISNSQFSNNLSSTGGGMYFANSNIDLIYCDISLNIAENTNNTGTGGGVMFSAYSSNSSNANIQNCTFYDNQANIIQANGIALAANASFGSGIYDLNIVNSIIWENVEIINNGTVNVSYSNTQNNFAGSGNISEISNFISIDPANPNYNLLLGSPCINSGNPSNIYNDFDGTRNDMGAYPYNFNTFLYDNLVSEELYTICNTNDSIQISSLHNNLSVSEFPGEIESFSYEGCFEGTHYYLSDGLHDWNDAESLCSENGGAMLEINSQLEQYFIQNIVVEGPNVFLGIKNDTLIWESGSDVIFSNWNTNDLVHDYGEFYWETFEWGMDPQTSEHRICLEIEGDGNCPQETSYLWSNGDTSSTAYFNSNDIGVNWLSQTINNILNDTFLIDISNSTSNIDISECDSYEWNGQTYTESGTYTYVNDNSYSIAFDGDNEYVNCGNGIDISNKSFTLSAWVKKDGADFTGASIVMSTGDGTINNGLYFGFNYQNGQDYLFFNFWGNGICYSTLPVNIEGDGEWHHIAATYNLLTNERILYLDGIIVGSDISQSAFMSSNTDFCIGITSWNLVDDFNGKIDDPCVWDRVLTQSEIQNYMNCPPTENESGLVGYWNFEEGEGEPVIDLSGNGNDGTINGAAYSSDISEQSCQLTIKWL